MKLTPKHGIGELLFGMKQKDVESLYGQADKQFNDEEDNVIWVYNAPKLRLTFYADEDLRFGYAITSNPDLVLFDKKIMNRNVADVKQELLAYRFSSWEQEDFDMAENHFNEDHWLILQTEFGVISKVEIGAIINDKDEFDWKYKK